MLERRVLATGREWRGRRNQWESEEKFLPTRGSPKRRKKSKVRSLKSILRHKSKAEAQNARPGNHLGLLNLHLMPNAFCTISIVESTFWPFSRRLYNNHRVLFGSLMKMMKKRCYKTYSGLKTKQKCSLFARPPSSIQLHTTLFLQEVLLTTCGSYCFYVCKNWNGECMPA